MPVPMEGPLDPICKLFCQQGFHSTALLQHSMSLIMSEHFPRKGTNVDLRLNVNVVFWLFLTEIKS